MNTVNQFNRIKSVKYYPEVLADKSTPAQKAFRFLAMSTGIAEIITLRRGRSYKVICYHYSRKNEFTATSLKQALCIVKDTNNF